MLNTWVNLWLERSFYLRKGEWGGDQKHIPLGVGFYPDWWKENYGLLTASRDLYYDPIYRAEPTGR